jgi:aromatic-L-amino-acid decarboxylase
MNRFREDPTWRGPRSAGGAEAPEGGRNGRPLSAPALAEEPLREIGHAFINLAVEYLLGLEGRRVYGPVSPAGLDDLFAEALPESGGGLAELIQELRTKVFPNTMAIGSRRYFGMMNPAPLPIAVFAEALTAALNQNVASWRHAPAATAIEKRVIRWLCDLCGLPGSSFGTFVPGGSLANITGLKLAINRALGRHIGQVGQEEPPGRDMSRLRFYVSNQAHYSFDKAADLLGIGREQVRKLPVDELFRVDLDAIEAAIVADRADGLRPAAIIGIAGTTNTGSVDKLDRLADLAQRHDCWYHVDAAYGGAVLISERFAPMLRGIERADSITVDPHKWFYIPFASGAVLVRAGDFLRRSFLVHPEYYMEKVLKEEAARDGEGPRELPDPRGFHMGDKVNFFQYGVQGSRRFSALKVWLALKATGRRQYAAWIEKDIELARLLASLLRREPDFELIGPNTLGICNFRWVPADPGGSRRGDPRQVDRLNRELQATVEQEGDAWFSYTVLGERVALRANVENRCMSREDIERLVRILRRTADRVLAGRLNAANGAPATGAPTTDGEKR